MKKLITICLSVMILSTACKDMINPELENNLELDNVYDNASYAQGLLLNGYARIPTNSWSLSDVATDDAVTNEKTSGFLKIATGQWTAINNPLDQWQNGRAAIQYLNLLLSVSDGVQWAINPTVNKMFNDRMKAEAYGLRALFTYHLLRAHAGKSNGQLLGIPLLTAPETVNSDFNIPRASFDACMEQIYRDLSLAEEALPLDYEDIATDSQVPQKYAGASKDDYNRVFGVNFRLRLTSRIAKAIRAEAALLAASDAYNSGNAAKWETAANAAATVINLRGGIGNLASNNLTWYEGGSGIDALASGGNPPEILWRTDLGTNNDLERANFPPTLYGNGRINPTQNLVDAFPMANGYPISDNTNSGYLASAPYTGRDPRLKLFITVNGSTGGTSGSVINTAADGTTNDGLNKVETSTRTGYYLRKLLRQDVNLNPSSTTTQRHFNARIRYTEIFLAYAEAANEAWGPTGKGTNSYSAFDVIKALRLRAGVGTANGDPYLQSLTGSKDDMRKLIRNERRLELCFEGFRFWDLRRWNANLTETAKGVSISGNNFNSINVENRSYQSYMNYGPIPYSEILKYNALHQNTGW